MEKFRFVMIGAMYENGGNTTQRFLDGHPELFVYPYESQVGTKFVQDSLSSAFPLKYRWPVFPTDASSGDCYDMIIDEELKVRTKTPLVSKFRNEPLELSDGERKVRFVKMLEGAVRLDAATVMACFFKSTFASWKDFKGSGKNHTYVGYSPVITVDADKILSANPDSHFIHVVRNPFSAYSDTKKRPVPLSLKNYMTNWVINQHFANFYSKIYGSRFHIVRFEDLIQDGQRALAPVCEAVGIDSTDGALRYPSWNSKRLEEVYPWGTIKLPTLEANLSTARELLKSEIQEIIQRTEPYLSLFEYQHFVDSSWVT
ncbi:sulfotransferase [Bdellovibrionota bacterium FG-2]